jgi:hypothetical protein
MVMPKSSIALLLEESRNEHPQPIVSKEEYRKAEKRINSEMEFFSIEQRAYFNQSVQSASTAYLTF